MLEVQFNVTSLETAFKTKAS